jgi:excisionase family DNA binding protein
VQLLQDGHGSRPYLTVAEAADYARCSSQRLYDLRTSGVLSRAGDGRKALVIRDELDAYLRSQKKR